MLTYCYLKYRIYLNKVIYLIKFILKINHFNMLMIEELVAILFLVLVECDVCRFLDLTYYFILNLYTVTNNFSDNFNLL